MLHVLLITTSTFFGLVKRKEIAAACAWILLYSLLVILNKAPERIRCFIWQTSFWNMQNINKYPECPVWALQTKKMKHAIFIALSWLALESTDKSAASCTLCSGAMTVGASPAASSVCLSTEIVLVLQRKFGIAMLPCQPYNLFTLQWTNMPVLLNGCNISQNMCIVTFLFLLLDCHLIHRAMSAASIWCAYPVIHSARKKWLWYHYQLLHKLAAPGI